MTPNTIPAWLLPAFLQTTPSQPAFEVASIEANSTNDPGNSNFPLGPGDAYTPNGGYFKATGLPAAAYISFAYKLLGSQAQSLAQQLPGWAMSERFDIQARAAGNPGKDEMRLMMRSLLAERFGLVVHFENRDAPVLALVLKNGKPGPKLVPHPPDVPCPRTGVSSVATVAGGFPELCGGLLMLPAETPGQTRGGARNVTMPFIANLLTSFSDLGRTIVDRTGLSGNYDFVLEWESDNRGPLPPVAETPSGPSGPSFQTALQEQLGLKLEAQRGAIEAFVIDHPERPSGN